MTQETNLEKFDQWAIVEVMVLEWREDTDELDNTFWEAASFWTNDGDPFYYRIRQRLEGDRVVFYDDSTSEIKTNYCWETVDAAKCAMQRADDHARKCEESEIENETSGL